MLAVALHLVVIVLLVVAFRWPAPSGEDVTIIQAVAVDEKQAQKRKAEAAKKKREQEAARKRKEAEKKRLTEARKKKEAERKRKEAEKQRLAEVKRKEDKRKRKEEAERKRREQERKKAEAEKQRLEEEKRRLAEEKQRLEKERQRVKAERQRREEERQRQEAEEQLTALMAAEEREREEVALRTRALTAAEKYKVLIRQKVTRNWVRPANTQEGLECKVRVRLVPNGEVLDVKVVRSSGNELFDRSVENAVYKASPLPLPEEKALFEYFREIEFLFNPEDES